MLKSRRSARLFLKNSNRENYKKIIHSAKLTPQQESVVNLYILQGLSICAVADELHISESGVRKILSNIYDVVYVFHKSACKLTLLINNVENVAFL